MLTHALEQRHGKTDLISLGYAEESALKQSALAQYWQKSHLPGVPESIIASPKPRHYRTNSKRRVQAGRITQLISVDGESNQQAALLEAEKHAGIYHWLTEKLNTPAFQPFAKHVNYIIIRGNYAQQTVILNLDEFNNESVRKAKMIGEGLKQNCGILAVFLYLDPTRSDYYLEFLRPAAAVTMKKLYGPDLIFLQIDGCKYSYKPFSFSQVNESLLPVMLQQMKFILSPGNGRRLLDIYCGYGLFSHYLAEQYVSTVGMDINREAIQSAIENKKHLHPEKEMRFIAKPVERKTCRRDLPQPDEHKEHLLLDPPYQGPDAGVVETLALRDAEKVLHLFCNVDRIRVDVASWEKQGYQVHRVLPLDMFPGTANLEIMILLQKS